MAIAIAMVLMKEITIATAKAISNSNGDVNSGSRGKDNTMCDNSNNSIEW